MVRVLKIFDEKKTLDGSGDADEGDMALLVSFQAVAKFFGWAWMACTVAPGFEFPDVKVEKRAKLIQAFPQHRKLTEQYTGE